MFFDMGPILFLPVPVSRAHFLREVAEAGELVCVGVVKVTTLVRDCVDA